MIEIKKTDDGQWAVLLDGTEVCRRLRKTAAEREASALQQNVARRSTDPWALPRRIRK